jgi:hypothetical protein
MALYTAIVVLVPAAVMGKRLSNRTLYERFMIYVVFGNFYIINIVFILQLMHISNRATLLLLYLVPVLFVLIKPHVREIGRFIVHTADVADRLTRGSIGWKTFLKERAQSMRRRISALHRKVSVVGHRQNLEAVAVVALVVLVGYMYGKNSIVNYGYLASDVAVHNYWINAMSENNIFVAGVYPHGFHCMIYFMHAVFGIKASVLLRLFAITNAVYVHMVLWAFIRYITKSRYAAYGALVIYVAVNFINSGAYSRFSCNLPQEYGMIFIFPTLYFLFEYMKHERTRGRKDRKYRARRRYELAGAAASFSLTIAVHFYGTMIIGLFCVAMVFSYFLRFFRPRFFLRLMAALILGIVVAALPMGVSIAQGNHFQGSIGWGLEVISGSKKSTTVTTSSGTEVEQTDVSSSSDFEADLEEMGIDASTLHSSDTGTSGSSSQTTTVSKPAKKSLKERIVNKCNEIAKGFEERIGSFILRGDVSIWKIAMPLSILAVCIYGFVLALIDWKDYDSDYGSWYITIGIGVLFVLAIIMAKYLGLPAVMDVNRGRIYYMYSYTVIIGILLDMIPSVISRLLNKPLVYNIVSLVAATALSVALFGIYGVRTACVNSRTSLMQTNGAVYSMYKIIEENGDSDNWTIVSPTDELRMLEGRGYHTETYEFARYLRRMTKFTIPTKYVYIFVEKIPLDYTIPNKYSNMKVSVGGASQVYNDYYTGNSMYKGEARYILMSKMYYWAKRYMEVYPEDFTVFYEDDEFVCYKLVQNTSFLNNLMVDFGYNR